MSLIEDIEILSDRFEDDYKSLRFESRYGPTEESIYARARVEAWNRLVTLAHKAESLLVQVEYDDQQVFNLTKMVEERNAQINAYILSQDDMNRIIHNQGQMIRALQEKLAEAHH